MTQYLLDAFYQQSPRALVMRKLAVLCAAVVAAAGLAWDTTSVARAEDFNCTGTVGNVNLDNIFVPNGESCVLNGTQAEGNIVVGTGATLQASGIRIDGNVQAEGATQVTVNNNSTVGGNIQLVQGGAATVANVRVDGDIQLESNNGALLADGNTVGGNLQAFQNSGGLTIRSNSMEGNLQCQENDPAPTGGNNRADNLEDQCARLSQSEASESFTLRIYLPGIH